MTEPYVNIVRASFVITIVGIGANCASSNADLERLETRDVAASPQKLAAEDAGPVLRRIGTKVPHQTPELLRRLASIALNRNVSAVDVATMTAKLGRGAPGELVDGVLDSDENFAFSVVDKNRFLLTNGNVTRDYISTTTDVGRTAARDQYRRVVEKLLGESIVSAGEYNFDAARELTVGAGEGDLNGPGRQWTNEYVFEAPRVVEGIEVLEAAIRVFVHRTGAVARIDFTDTPLEIVGRASRTVPQADIESVFRKQNPSAKVAWSGVRYMLDPSSDRIQPCFVYHFSFTGGDGKIEIESRSRRACYSLTDPSAPPLMQPRSDGKTRQSDQRPASP